MSKIKTKVVKVNIVVFKGILRFTYLFLKLFPTNESKVLFCSRQSNDIPLDFLLIQNELSRSKEDIKFVNICCHIGHKASDYVRFAKALLKSMYHLATCRVCLLDSYWPTVSILNHKKNLKVIQIWHAVGKIKKSGYQTLGKVSGRKKDYADILNMHKNYDYVIAGANYWNKFYCKSFDITEDKILNYGLPRIDYLLRTKEKNKESFFNEYPEFKEKKIILYAPTFRRHMKSHWERITKEIKKDDGLILIVKRHPGETNLERKNYNNVSYINDWKMIDLISVCDYFITDYSAGALEAAVLEKKTYYWVYDYKEYTENNGLNIDMKRQMAPYVFTDIKKLMDNIRNDEYDENFIKNYKAKYLPEDMGCATEKITNFIINIIEEKA